MTFLLPPDIKGLNDHLRLFIYPCYYILQNKIQPFAWEAYSGFCQTSKMKRFVGIVDGSQLLTIFAKVLQPLIKFLPDFVLQIKFSENLEKVVMR